MARPTDSGMVRRRFGRRAGRSRAGDCAEVARWLGVFWACRCRYRNAASYRCYGCGSRPPVRVRTLVADTLRAADQVASPERVPEPAASLGG
ncbi:MAG: hypothetical protein QOE93_663 [Actinomycetota bacterium]|nr:hypothetical protein [Actinomycetota bacterium]